MADQHIVRFVDDPIAAEPREISFLIVGSYAEAIDKALAQIGTLRKIHGELTSYIIQDITGRNVMIGPGKDWAQEDN